MESALKSGAKYRCPCCGFCTLSQRGGFEICPVCFWEDDGQDDANADEILGGPNSHLSLATARANYKIHKASDAKHASKVRPPEGDENFQLHLSERYDGLAAEFWGLMGGNTPEADLPFFENAIRAGGGRALDLTCGSGKHLIPYLKAGLDVDGVDASLPLLDQCRGRAAAIGRTPALYCQLMQALDLPHRYHTIFISVGSFHLLKEREEAMETLRRCHRHLLPGGKLYITAYRPTAADNPEHREGGCGNMGPITRPEDGATLTVTCWVENVDTRNHVITERRHYVKTQPGQPTKIQEAVLYQRWYDIDELKAMIASAGFTDIFVHRDFSPESATAWKNWLVFRGTKNA